jgi:hypothetical protein
MLKFLGPLHLTVVGIYHNSVSFEGLDRFLVCRQEAFGCRIEEIMMGISYMGP